MYSAQKLKIEMDLNKDLADLLDVLKGIAASQFRIMMRRKERFSRFTQAFKGFFPLVDFAGLDHPFVAEGQGRPAIIIITSDEGFMGGLNARIIRAALTCPDAGRAELLIIGRRGADYLKGVGRDFKEFSGPGQGRYYDLAVQLRDYVMRQSLSGRISRLVVVYSRPLSFTAQRVEILSILPCRELFADAAQDDNAGMAPEEKEGVIMESSSRAMVEYLAGLWIKQVLLEAFEDSKLAEFSARTVHLEQSHQNLERRGRGLRLRYFRSHHELIDKGMRESFSAQVIRRRR